MMIRTRAARLTLAACTAAALGFGAAQALAAPSGDAGGAAVCRPGDCSRACKASGADGGKCTGGMCVCYIGPVEP